METGMSTDSNMPNGNTNSNPNPNQNKKNKQRGFFKGKRPFDRQGTDTQEAHVPSAPPPECGLCHKPIFDVTSAINNPTSGLPCHFDCVLTSLTEAEKPTQGQRVIYLGGGCFAVADYGTNPQSTKFTIVRKIQFEEKDKRPEWRKDLAARVLKS